MLGSVQRDQAVSSENAMLRPAVSNSALQLAEGHPAQGRRPMGPSLAVLFGHLAGRTSQRRLGLIAGWQETDGRDVTYCVLCRRQSAKTSLTVTPLEWPAPFRANHQGALHLGMPEPDGRRVQR